MNLLIIFAAKYLYMLIGVIAVATFVLSNQKVRVQFVKLSIFTFPFSLIVAWILNALIQSPRPFIVENIQPLIQSSPDNGFPSDHTLLAMTIASVIYTYNKKIGTLLIVLSLLVGISRVLAHVHHGIDIVGSVLIAIMTTYLSYRYAVKRFTYKLPYLEA